jgi:hypothetical protein
MHRWPSVVQGIQVLDRVLAGDDHNSIRQRRGVGWYTIALLTLTAIYFITGRLGLSLGAANRFATLIWLPSRLAMSALLLWGSDLWPALILGALLLLAAPALAVEERGSQQIAFPLSTACHTESSWAVDH